MIRILLVQCPGDDWRTFRQEQWMAEVRRNPSASHWSRIHFDIEEDSYRELVECWTHGKPGWTRESAVDRLIESGAVKIAAR